MRARVVVVKEYRVRCETCAAFGYHETDHTMFSERQVAESLLGEHIDSGQHKANLKKRRAGIGGAQS